MRVVGALIVVLSLAIAAVPLFTDCQSQGNAIALANGKTIPMKCHWTGRAELAVAAPLLTVGAVMAGSRRKHTVRALSVLGIVLGTAAILLPSGLIGVCSSPDMLCNMVMRPTLMFAGALAVGASAAGLLLARDGMDELG